MTIEYDEEVKLHDGEMIWVHITRHYIEGGGKEISEMFRGGGKNVIPTHVEIAGIRVLRGWGESRFILTVMLALSINTMVSGMSQVTRIRLAKIYMKIRLTVTP